MWPVLIAVIAGLLVWIYIAARRPLGPDEIDKLVVRRIFAHVDGQLGFVSYSGYVDPRFKSAMDASGRLYAFDTSLSQFPGVAAAMLKGKKHEWIVIGFARQGHVVGVWMNKGPNSETVSALLSFEQIYELAVRQGADTIVDIHNHPNPNPAQYTTAGASAQDAIRAGHCGEYYSRRGVRFVGLIAERGNFHPYACWVPEEGLRPKDVRADILRINGTSGEANAGLRSELSMPCALESALKQPHASHNLGHRSALSDLISAGGPVPRPQALGLHPGGDTPPTIERKPAVGQLKTARPERVPAASPVPMTAVDSSNIVEVGYSQAERCLFIRFKGGGLYRYHGVEPDLFSDLLAATSKGSFVQSRVVSGPYSYDRMWG